MRRAAFPLTVLAANMVVVPALLLDWTGVPLAYECPGCYSGFFSDMLDDVDTDD